MLCPAGDETSAPANRPAQVTRESNPKCSKRLDAQFPKAIANRGGQLKFARRRWHELLDAAENAFLRPLQSDIAMIQQTAQY